MAAISAKRYRSNDGPTKWYKVPRSAILKGLCGSAKILFKIVNEQKIATIGRAVSPILTSTWGGDRAEKGAAFDQLLAVRFHP